LATIEGTFYGLSEILFLPSQKAGTSSILGLLDATTGSFSEFFGFIEPKEKG